MCGIAGISGQFHDLEIEQSLQSLLHRGPDGHGIFKDFSRRVGLCHARLAIQDLSKSASQPMVSADGNLVLVFNGEIYNFKEIRKILEKKN